MLSHFVNEFAVTYFNVNLYVSTFSTDYLFIFLSYWRIAINQYIISDSIYSLSAAIACFAKFSLRPY